MNWPKKSGTVLVPFDFSDPSKEALRVALQFVGRPDQVLVLYAVTPLLVTEPGVVWNTLNEDDARRGAMDSLSEALAGMDLGDVRRDVQVGIAANVILERAKREDAEMIVISTHGRSGVRRFFMGSVAELVVRHAECPVLVLRHGVDGDPST